MKNLSPFNVVFGIGSFTYTYVTRDEYGFAMKATAVRRNGQIVDIFKKPATSDGFNKNGLKGIPVVLRGSIDDHLYVKVGGTSEELENCALKKFTATAAS